MRFLEAKFFFHQHQFGFSAKYFTEHACNRVRVIEIEEKTIFNLIQSGP